MGNLDLYDKVRSVPKEAQKPIIGGRLKGMTDINPMWRIKTLTERFGVCGFGWKPEIVEKFIDKTDGEWIATVVINLYVKMNGEWSEPIPGIGGSKIIAVEGKGPYVDDEAYKKAYTDALSVACKALGIGADVYWSRGTESKYQEPAQTVPNPAPFPEEPVFDEPPIYYPNTPVVQQKKTKFMQVQELLKAKPNLNMDLVGEWIAKKFGCAIPVNDLSDEQFAALAAALSK